MRKKDLIELWITVVLGILLVIACFVAAHRRDGPRNKSSTTSPVRAATVKPRGAEVLPDYRLYRKKGVHGKFLDRFVAATATLSLERNPFTAGQDMSSNARASLVLDGIMWDEKKPTVIINAHFLSEGDVFDRFKVVKIHPTKVVLQEGVAEFELALNGIYRESEEGIKKP